MSAYLEDFKRVIRECNYSNTYKMAWAKGIVELTNEYVHNNAELVRIPIIRIAEKMVKYYWDQTIYFNLFQSAPNQPPIILQEVQELIALYQIDYDYIPIVFNRVSSIILSKYEKQYKKAIKICISNIKNNVMPFFLNLEKLIFNFYSIDSINNEIVFSLDNIKEINEHQQDLYDLINYRWSLMLENYNSCPRIAKKVRIMDEQEVRRQSNLVSFDKYLDFENQEHRCFICGEKITNATLSRDHVIPWSYMYSDDLWNLVYVHKSCNSLKSNVTPSEEQIEKLKERNKRLQIIINEKCRNEGLKKGTLLQSFDYAIENDYVEKFYLGCKGC